MERNVVVKCSRRHSPGQPPERALATAIRRRPHSQSPRHRRARGQAMVEFALVAPLFFLVFFGFVEFALINASIAGYNFAAKDGARIGSLLGRTDSTVDTQIVTDIRVHVAGIVMAQPIQIEIFKADEGGNPISAGGSIVENVYDINGTAIGTPSWPVDSRNDTLLDADYLGVKITFKYTYLTSYVSGGNASLTLTANSVQRIEPQDYQGDREHAGRVALLTGLSSSGSGVSSHPGSRPPGNTLFASAASIWIRSPDAEVLE